MPISFSGTINELQLRRAIKKQMYAGYILGYILFLFGIIALLKACNIDASTHSSSFLPPAFLLVVGLLLTLLPWITARRQFRTNKLIGLPQQCIASDQHLSINMQIGSAEITWDCFHRTLISKNIILLFQSTAVFHIFPREFFKSESDWNEFQTCVRQKVKRKRNTFLWATVAWTILILIVLIILHFIPRA